MELGRSKRLNLRCENPLFTLRSTELTLRLFRGGTTCKTPWPLHGESYRIFTPPNHGPTQHPTGNLVADTIHPTTQIGLAITNAAGAEAVTVFDAIPVAVDESGLECGTCHARSDHGTC